MKNEDGSIFILITIFIALALLISVYAVDFGLFFLEKSHVQNSADASALSAAQAVATFEENPCDEARTTAEDNQVKLLECDFDQEYATVLVASSNDGRIKSRARAQVSE